MPPGAPFAADVLAAAEQVRRMRGSPRLGAALASPSSAENNKQREDAEVLRSARAMLQDLARRFAGRQHVQPEEALFAAPGCSEGDGGGRLSVVALAASAVTTGLMLRHRQPLPRPRWLGLHMSLGLTVLAIGGLVITPQVLILGTQAQAD